VIPALAAGRTQLSLAGRQMEIQISMVASV
jgi:hypothetical protein